MALACGSSLRLVGRLRLIITSLTRSFGSPISPASTFSDQFGRRSISGTSFSQQMPLVEPPLPPLPEFDFLKPRRRSETDPLPTLASVEPASEGTEEDLGFDNEIAIDFPSMRTISTEDIIKMDAQTLKEEMNNCLVAGRAHEAVRLFEDWKSNSNPLTLEPNKPDRVMYNMYMSARLKSGADYDELVKIVTEMEEAGMPRDLASYNFLLRGLFRSRNAAVAESVLHRMEKDPSAQPDSDSYNLVVVLCAFDKKVDVAVRYMKSMLEKGLEPSRATINEVVLAAARAYQTNMVSGLVNDLKRANKFLPPQMTTCGELLMSASEIDDAESTLLALNLLAEKPVSRFIARIIVDEGTILGVLGTAARTANLALSEKAWEIIRNPLHTLKKMPSPELFLAKIHAHASCGDLMTAFTILAEMEKTYAKSDPELFSPFSSLRSLAVACSKNGPTALDKIYYHLEDMHKKKQNVSVAALNCAIAGCANLWDAERAYQTFEAVESVFGLRPNIHSCNALISALGKTKKAGDALKVYDYIQAAGFKPDRWTYSLLVDAHIVNRDPKSALDVLQTMVEASIAPFRESIRKVCIRCLQLSDRTTTDRLKNLQTRIGYRPNFFVENRRQQLLYLYK